MNLLPAFTASKHDDLSAFENRVFCADALDLLAALPDASVDMVLCDLPYGYEKTKTVWDSNKAPFNYSILWSELKRIINKRGAIALTSAQPFTTDLISSNREMYRYSVYWQKNRGSNFGHSHYQPLRIIEEILIFSHSIASPNQYTTPDDTMKYYPQMTLFPKSVARVDKPHHAKVSRPSKSSHIQNPNLNYVHICDGKLPTTLIKFSMDSDSDRGIHPTQKPVALFEYLIKTYTRAGDTVLDMTCGSGTTAVACVKTNRRYICGDNGRDDRTGRLWSDIAQERIRNTDPYQATVLANGQKQLSLFEGVAG
jgi:site-specific DNA-methyltransferase (adenine-specific)